MAKSLSAKKHATKSSYVTNNATVINKCTLTVFLRKDQHDKDNKLTVYFQFFINRERKLKSLGIKCHPKDWDAKSENIKDRNNTDHLFIEKKKADFIKILADYQLMEKRLTGEEFINLWEGRTSSKDFIKFFEFSLEDDFANNRIARGTYKSRKVTLKKLKEFAPEISMNAMDVVFFNKFDAWHFKRLKANAKNKPLKFDGLNARNNAKKHIRVYLKQAKHKYNIEDPFEKGLVKTKEIRGKKVYLQPHELEAMQKLYKEQKLPVHLKRHLLRFLISCFTGLRVSDSRNVLDMPIINNHLIFTPEKTSRQFKELQLPLNKSALHFIEELRAEEGYAAISDQKFNAALKIIAIVAGIQKHITTHTGRHTFGTMFIRSGGDLVVLKDLLGHSDIRTTMQYAELVDEETTRQEQINKMDAWLQL
jgi:integrase/recombinase XerD